MDVVYLGISEELHPSESTYRLLYGRSVLDDGHARYEGVGVLHKALERWPATRVILTSTQPWRYGLPSVLEHLGLLAACVDGFTYEELTKKRIGRAKVRAARRQVLRSDVD